jgi:hypothetical protein
MIRKATPKKRVSPGARGRSYELDDLSPVNFALTEFSEVRGYNPPRFVPVLPADASPCLPRCPGSGLLDMYVTRIRYEPLQLATGRTSENLLVGEVRIPPVRYRKGSP